jgi:hypothetical protein
VVATLPTRDPAATLREVQNHGKTGPLELISENAIHGRNEGVRHALEFESDVIDSELLGVEHVRFLAATSGVVLGVRGGQREGELRAGAMTNDRAGNGRGVSPGLLNE